MISINVVVDAPSLCLASSHVSLAFVAGTSASAPLSPVQPQQPRASGHMGQEQQGDWIARWERGRKAGDTSSKGPNKQGRRQRRTRQMADKTGCVGAMQNR